MDALVLAGMGRGMGRGAVVHVGVVRLLLSVLECIPSLPGAGVACVLARVHACSHSPRPFTTVLGAWRFPTPLSTVISGHASMCEGVSPT